MIISTRDLPSKGYKYSIETVELHPCTLKQVIEYDRSPANIFLQRLYRDIQLLEMDVKDLTKISYYDFDSLVFIKKSLSITSKVTMEISFSCPKCGYLGSNYTINLNDLDYPKIRDAALMISKIKIAGEFHSIRIPSVKQVKDCCELFLRYKQDIDPLIFNSCVLFDFTSKPNFYKALVENAVRDEITLIDLVHELCDGSKKVFEICCTKCKEKSVVGVNTLITDLFRHIRVNQEIQKFSIETIEVLPFRDDGTDSR